jgi:hypothetical protein
MSDSDDDEILAEIEYMDKTFADAEFSVCLKIDELDDIVSTEKTIVIKNSQEAWWEPETREMGFNHFFYVIKLDVMSKRNIIFELIKKGLEGDGDHRFLESISPTREGNNTQFELSWGS